jgi:cellulose synthase/poly-beta-1,6-N-acetylglucosamine synthase-like glycosyltransferase
MIEGSSQAASRRRLIRLEPEPSAIVRWSAALFVVAAGLAVPYLHWMYKHWDSASGRSLARLAVFAVLAAWFLGRPVAVVVADRLVGHGKPVEASFNPGVSVIVPCHNAAPKIEETLRSILLQGCRPIEIILVENNSTDNTWEVLLQLERAHAEVRVFWIPPEPGEYAASIALNVAVERARYPVILRLDDDTFLAPGAIDAALHGLFAPNTVAVACNLRVANPDQSIWTRLQALEYMLAMEVDRRCQALFQSVLVCSGGMQIFLRDVIRGSGGYVAVPREVSEDMDMTMKAHRKGLVAVAPESIGFTEVPATLEALLHQRRRWAISGTVGLWLHRRGIFWRDYWHHGMVGFLGLPMRAVQLIRDLLPFVLLVDVAFLVHERIGWVVALILARMTLIGAQVALVRPALRCRQASTYWRLIPFFTLVYGPLLVVARFVGTVAGVLHVMGLREKLAALEQEMTERLYEPDMELEPIT